MDLSRHALMALSPLSTGLIFWRLIDLNKVHSSLDLAVPFKNSSD